jgi:hypothetical protein
MYKSKIIPPDEKFPISFKHALCLAVGGDKTKKRLPIFKAWWKSKLEHYAKMNGHPLIDNTDQQISIFIKEGVDKPWLNNMIGGIAEFRKKRISERNRKAAQARWKSYREVQARPERKKKKV